MSADQPAAPAANAPSEASVSDSNPTTEAVGSQEAAPVAEPVKPSKRKLTLKVDGQEEEVEYDPSDDEYIRKQFQLARASQNRMKETADLRNKMDQIGNYLEQARGDKTKLRALIKELGADEKELAAMIIEEEIANSQKTPQQLEKEKLENELRQMKEERDREKTEWTKKEFERLQQQEYERYDILMSQALEKSDLPKSPYTVKKLSDYMLLGLEKGVELTPEELLPLVREEIQEDVRQMFSAMPEEVIEKLIGTDVLKKLRKKNIAKAREGAVPPVPVKSSVKDVGAGKSAAKAPEAKKTIKQLFGV